MKHFFLSAALSYLVLIVWGVIVVTGEGRFFGQTMSLQLIGANVIAPIIVMTGIWLWIFRKFTERRSILLISSIFPVIVAGIAALVLSAIPGNAEGSFWIILTAVGGSIPLVPGFFIANYLFDHQAVKLFPVSDTKVSIVKDRAEGEVVDEKK